MTNAVLWVEVVVFAIFVALRLYTRISILSAVGPDDYLVCVALVSSRHDLGAVHLANPYESAGTPNYLYHICHCSDAIWSRPFVR